MSLLRGIHECLIKEPRDKTFLLFLVVAAAAGAMHDFLMLLRRLTIKPG